MFARFRHHLRAVVMLGAGLLGVSAASAQDAVHWRIQSNLNAGEPGYVALQEKFADLATEMSGGRITFEIYPVGALFPIADGLEAVGAGVTEMAVLTGGYYAGKLGPIAERLKELKANPAELDAILAKGAEKARVLAAPTPAA